MHFAVYFFKDKMRGILHDTWLAISKSIMQDYFKIISLHTYILLYLVGSLVFTIYSQAQYISTDLLFHSYEISRYIIQKQM